MLCCLDGVLETLYESGLCVPVPASFPTSDASCMVDLVTLCTGIEEIAIFVEMAELVSCIDL